MKYIEKSISQFIESQFPALYKEEGPTLIAFIQSYFEWLESSGNIINKTRRLFEYRDIDNTLDEYIVYFKNKYAKNLPLNSEADKRLLIKNIHDLYKSKGSERSYEILFRTLYNKDVKIYYPGDDILRVSDGEWYEGKYLEITSFVPDIQSYVGKKIIGVNSRASAIVESYVQKIANRKVVDVLEISNINGTFDYGERIFTSDSPNIIGATVPTTVGSLSAIGIIDGGANFAVGDILDVNGKGASGKAKVTATRNQQGRVNFLLEDGGSGYSLNALSKINSQVQLFFTSSTGNIQSGQLAFNTAAGVMVANGEVVTSNSTSITLKQITPGFEIGNTVRTAIRVIMDVNTGTFANGEYVYQSNGTANVGSGQIVGIVPGVGNTAFYISNVTGSFTTSVYSISGNSFILVGNTSSAQGFIYNIVGGSNTGSLSVANIVGGGTGATFKIGAIMDKEIVTINTDYLRDKLDTKIIAFNESSNNPGTVSVTNGGNTVTGVGTSFNTDFVIGDYIQVSNSAAKQIREVTSVTNSTVLTVAVNFSNTQTGAPYYEDISNYSFAKAVTLGDIERVSTKIIDALTFQELEIGTIQYLAGINPGTGYSLDPYVSVIEPVIAALEIPGVGNRVKGADAVVVADAGVAEGLVQGVTIIDSGIGYEPGERVTLTKPGSAFAVTGAAIVKTQGKQTGYWRSTKGFLNSDKYIQDSKYYQEYSYEVNTGLNFSAYKDVVLELLHTAGTEFFGRYMLNDELANTGIVFAESAIS
jgi:hypothetical protein